MCSTTLLDQSSNSRELCRKSFDLSGGVVRGCVVDENDLETIRRILLRDEALDSPPEPLHTIVGRNDYRDKGSRRLLHGRRPHVSAPTISRNRAANCSGPHLRA